MNSKKFGDILTALPSYFESYIFINAFDKYIIYLSREQLTAYNNFIDNLIRNDENWNEFYMKLFPNEPFPKGFDKFLRYRKTKLKKRHWVVASLFRNL